MISRDFRIDVRIVIAEEAPNVGRTVRVVASRSDTLELVAEISTRIDHLDVETAATLWSHALGTNFADVLIRESGIVEIAAKRKAAAQK
jgi:hypothetical protein